MHYLTIFEFTGNNCEFRVYYNIEEQTYLSYTDINPRVYKNAGEVVANDFSLLFIKVDDISEIFPPLNLMSIESICEWKNICKSSTINFGILFNKVKELLAYLKQEKYKISPLKEQWIRSNVVYMMTILTAFDNIELIPPEWPLVYIDYVKSR